MAADDTKIPELRNGALRNLATHHLEDADRLATHHLEDADRARCDARPASAPSLAPLSIAASLVRIGDALEEQNALGGRVATALENLADLELRKQ